MKQHTNSYLFVLLFALLLGACGATPEAQVEPPTPTPLPPDPALERPTYTVERGAIERVLEVTGRVTPVDLVRLSFRRDGRVNIINSQRGNTVKAGDIIAELQQDEALDDLRQAQDDVVQAQRDLENAQKAQAKDIREKELEVEEQREALNRLLPGGEDDVIRAAQEELEKAQREANTAQNDGSWTKTSAEEALLGKAEALEDTQKAYSKAKWNLDWVENYGTHPTERVAAPTEDDPDRTIPRKLTDEEKEQFKEALVKAERDLRAAERAIEEGQRAVDKAREDEVVGNQEAQEKVQEAQRELDKLISGTGSKELRDAQRALDQALLALDEARTKTLNSEIRNVENAQRALAKAERTVADGRIIAPQDGELIVISLEEGATVTAFDPVVELADTSNLEFAATLSGEQMRQLTEGQPAEIRLLSRPDVPLEATIRLLPAPYGSGGSGSVEDRDPTTRFEVTDTKGQELKAGTTIGKIRIVLERKEDVLLLPPEAIRSFEGRRFVVVREGERERRVTVRIGITTDTQVEVLEGLEEGDVIVGQ